MTQSRVISGADDQAARPNTSPAIGWSFLVCADSLERQATCFFVLRGELFPDTGAKPGIRECRPMAGRQLPKLDMRVQIPSFAPGALSATGNFASCFQKQGAMFCPRWVEVRPPRAYMRMSSSGKTLAFQAKNAGSIPAIRSKTKTEVTRWLLEKLTRSL